MALRNTEKSSKEKILQLQRENAEYKHLAEVDWLTGLYNRGAMERYVNAALKKKRAGSIIVFDLDFFKRVNDQYGHIAGDRFLEAVGEILTKMMPKNCLIGRVGGDEFAIFSQDPYTEAEMENRCRRIKERFKEIQLSGGIKLRISLTIGWSGVEKCWSYSEIFDLADQKVIAQKRLRQADSDEPEMDMGEELKSVNQDIRLIVKDLLEKDGNDGAYCQDYETFRRVFRLELRRMQRKDSDVYLILFTLTGADNHYISISRRDGEMELLGREIQKNLRVGDVYTQYSSCQYLVMLPDVQEQYIDMIAERIRHAYYEQHGGVSENVMLHRSYPMRSMVRK